MNSTVIHVGVDVDDTQYHGSAFNRDSGEVVDFQSRPTLNSCTMIHVGPLLAVMWSAT